MILDKNILINAIKEEHTWWYNKEEVQFNELSKRKYFKGFYDLIKQEILNRAVVLMGPRQVGKTVMMYQAIKDLINSGVNPKKILYFSLDTPIYTNVPLKELIELALNATNSNIKGCYVFFDEIQYFKDWEIHLKSLVDKKRETKFIASGSAAAALKMKSVESGAGRFTDYFLPPLTFSEYIDLNGYDNLLEETTIDFKGSQPFYKAKNIENFNNHFYDYINFGGFPEIALNKHKLENPGRIIQKDITERVIMRDLPGLFGIENTLELQQFFNVLSYRTGEISSFKNICDETGIDIKTIKKYVEYLESAFLIKVLHRVDISPKSHKKITQFKVYLTNPSLFSGLFGNIEIKDERFPHLVETAIFAQFLHRNHQFLRYAYWKRNKIEGEVDLVQLKRNFQKAEWALEVKWTDSFKTKNLKYFMEKNKIKKGIITSKTIFKDGLDLLVVPNSVYAYVVGKNALEPSFSFENDFEFKDLF